MKIKYLIAAAGAALGLSLSGYTASADTAGVAQPGSSLTLIHAHSSGGSGGYHPSFSYSPGMGAHPSWQGMHPSWQGVHPNWRATHPNWKAVHPNWTGMHHHHDRDRYHGRRGYWRHGHWYWYGYGGIGGDSCYPECLAEGYSPAYCTANAYAFCW